MVLPVLQSLLTLALLVAAFGFMAKRLLHIAVLINTGTRGDEILTDHPGERTRTMLAYTLGQQRLMDDRAAGLLHGIFLYGFLVLGLGHLEVVLEGLTAFLRASGGRPFLYERVLPSGLGALYHLSQDVLAAAVLAAGVLALVRRITGRPSRLLPRSKDGERILWFIVALYATFFVLVGATVLLKQRAAGDPAPLPYQPMSSLAARAFSFLSTPGAKVLRAAGWWSHVLVFLGFAAYLPTTKHMHLVFAWPNTWLFRRRRYGLPPRIDFEKTEKFGIDRVQELPWKSLLDSYACTECGRCNAVCPAHVTGKPLMPMKVLHDVKVNLRDRNGADILRLRDPRGRPLPGRAEGGGGVRAQGRLSSRRPRSTAQGRVPRVRTAATCRWTARSTSTSCGRARPALRASRRVRC